MNNTEKIDRFIAERRAERVGRRTAERLLPGTVPFVTISSQSGAGGHRVADTLLEMLERDAGGHEALRDWRLFDKSMCTALLEREHLGDALSDLLDESHRERVTEFASSIFGDGGMQDVARARLARLLRTLASVGRVVVLGHGGSLATRGLDGGLHLRLVAPLPIRAERMAGLLGVGYAAAERMIEERDTSQRKVLKRQYRVDSDDPEHYDIVCNTERMTPQTVAETVLALLGKRLGIDASGER